MPRGQGSPTRCASVGASWPALPPTAPAALRAALEDECRVKTFGLGEVCVSQGKSNNLLHVIVSGSAAVEVKGKQVAVLKAVAADGHERWWVARARRAN